MIRFQSVPLLASFSLAFTLTSAGIAQSPLWLQQFGDVSTSANVAVPDLVGGAFLGGRTTGSFGGASSGSADVWFARMDEYGNRVWTRQIGSEVLDILYAAAPDATGGVFFVGTTNGVLGGTSSSSTDSWIAHYDADGTQLWLEQRAQIYLESLECAAPDGLGGLYVAGRRNDQALQDQDILLVRLDSTGNDLWAATEVSSGSDSVHGVCPDARGGAYVGGETIGNLAGPNAGLVDGWVARYDDEGTQLWIQSFGSAGSEWVVGVSADGVGGAFVYGRADGALGGSHAGQADVWVARVSPGGQVEWIDQFGSDQQDFVLDGAASPEGVLFLSGMTSGDLGGVNDGQSDAWVARYDRDGTRLWVKQIGGASDDLAAGVAVTSTGDAIACGFTAVGITSQSSEPVAWSARFRSAAGEPYCASTSNSTGEQGETFAFGSRDVTDNDIRLVALRMPLNEFGYFLASPQAGFAPTPGSNMGNLCLGGRIGRYRGGFVQSTGGSGSFERQLSLRQLPSIAGPVTASAGETWHFQAWFRDGTAGHFTDATRVQLD